MVQVGIVGKEWNEAHEKVSANDGSNWMMSVLMVKIVSLVVGM